VDQTDYSFANHKIVLLKCELTMSVYRSRRCCQLNTVATRSKGVYYSYTGVIL